MNNRRRIFKSFAGAELPESLDLSDNQLTVLLTPAGEKPKRQEVSTTPEIIAQRKAALEEVRELNPYRDITDPVAWRREIREGVVLPGRE
ncbi:MAG: hypothetical protein K1X78_01965 [Verrucomicrobiaceae bacterium]|nr:hypothetical protein [Verrucomicrobiaceae bacterium]